MGEMNDIPDYAALAKMIWKLRRWPDALAETMLDPEEALQIRSLGFVAEPGPWKVPAIPPEVVAYHRLPEHLSNGWDSRRQQTWQEDARTRERAERVVSKPAEVENQSNREAEPVKEASRKILRIVETNGGRIGKRRLQQGAHRLGAQLFHQAFEELVGRQIVKMERNEVVLVAAAGR